MNGFVTVLRQVITRPEILIGAIACMGLILQRKGFSKTVLGTVKTILGMFLLFTGAELIVRSLVSLTPMVLKVFGTEGLVPMSAVLLGEAMESMPDTVTTVLFGGFALNILLARFTKWKYVFLSGEHMMYISALLPLVVTGFGMTGIARTLMCCGLAGIIYTYLPAIDNAMMKDITGGQPIAMGHTGATGYYIAGLLGRWFGDRSKSTEDMQLPQGLEFLKDFQVVTAIVISLLFLGFGVLCGQDFVNAQMASQGIEYHWILNSLFQGVWFAAGLNLLMYGVRMMVAELVPAFKGIADKMVPNAIPALDCPVIFPFAPNAVVLGFLASLGGGAIATIGLRLAGGLFVVPPMMEHFFMGGTAGIFGNKTGGRRGAIIGGVVNGMFFTLLPLLLYQYTKLVVPQAVTMVDTDLCLGGILAGSIARLLHSLGLF